MSPEGINTHTHTHTHTQSKLTENHSLLRELTHTHSKLIENHSRQIGLKRQLLSSIPIQRCQWSKSEFRQMSSFEPQSRDPRTHQPVQTEVYLDLKGSCPQPLFSSHPNPCPWWVPPNSPSPSPPPSWSESRQQDTNPGPGQARGPRRAATALLLCISWGYRA